MWRNNIQPSISPDLITRLRRAGYKITPARLAVLQVIEAQGAHLNPAEIYERSLSIHSGVGRATIYRTLELLTELGIVRPIHMGEQSVTYIRAEGGHHHLICERCGRTVEFEQCTADEVAQELAQKFGFIIHSHLLEFYGLCPTCKT